MLTKPRELSLRSSSPRTHPPSHRRTKRFWDTLADIQYGRNDHGTKGWSQVI